MLSEISLGPGRFSDSTELDFCVVAKVLKACHCDLIVIEIDLRDVGALVRS